MTPADQLRLWAQEMTPEGSDAPEAGPRAQIAAHRVSLLTSAADDLDRLDEKVADNEHLRDSVRHAVTMMRGARQLLDQFDDRIDEFVHSELACFLDDEPCDINGDLYEVTP